MYGSPVLPGPDVTVRLAPRVHRPCHSLTISHLTGGTAVRIYGTGGRIAVVSTGGAHQCRPIASRSRDSGRQSAYMEKLSHELAYQIIARRKNPGLVDQLGQIDSAPTRPAAVQPCRHQNRLTEKNFDLDVVSWVLFWHPADRAFNFALAIHRLDELLPWNWAAEMERRVQRGLEWWCRRPDAVPASPH
jgi:hypothetical protein